MIYLDTEEYGTQSKSKGRNFIQINLMYATNFVPIETPHRLKRLKLDPEMFNDFSYKQQVNRMVDAVIKSNLQRD